MKAKEIMTANPRCCAPGDSLQDVARSMRECDCGALPVLENDRVIGIVSDRDLAVRGLANGKSFDAKVGDIITRDPRTGSVNDDVREIERIMADNQVRRVPIVDGDGRCVGIIAQADLARAALNGTRVTEQEVAIVVESISEPSHRP